MKTRKFIPLLLLLPLSSCSWWPFGKKDNNKTKPELVIANVDVTNLSVNLPTIPTYNTGSIRSDETYEYIDMYELSDFHGAVSYETESSKTNIGLKKLATYLNNKRALNEGGTLVLSSGDMFQGSADSNLTRGYMVNYCMNYMGFDAMAVGNHEFDWSEEWLKNNAELKYNTTSVPFLGANIVKKSQSKMPDYLKKSTIVERGDYKIGIIGVIGSRLEKSILKTLIEDFDFVSYGDIVSQEAARLKNEDGCNAVILLAHDQADLLETFTGVDAAFGGHAHNDYPDAYPNNTRTLATANYGTSVAHISLKFDKTTKACAGVENYNIDKFTSAVASLEDNAGISQIIGQYDPEINKVKNIKLGTCDGDLKRDKALKNISNEAMYKSAVSAVKNSDSGVDSSKIIGAFTNTNGGIRSDISKGEITYGDVYKCFPFDNEVILIKEKGSYFKDHLYTLKELSCYRVFEDKSYFKDDEDYYLVTTDYLATSDQFKKFNSYTDEDLIRTGKVARDEIAKLIYDIDNVKVSQYDTTDLPYKQIPMMF